jgi:hypothetical protein
MFPSPCRPDLFQTHHASYPIGTGGKADHSPQTSFEVKYARISRSVALHCRVPPMKGGGGGLPHHGVFST